MTHMTANLNGENKWHKQPTISAPVMSSNRFNLDNSEDVPG
jgi:hypothetical protein